MIYRVTLLETLRHEVVIEAHTPEDAGRLALDAVREHTDPVADNVCIEFGTYSESDMRVFDVEKDR